MLGGRLIAAVAAATAATLPLVPLAAAAPPSSAPDVLARVAPADAADVLGGAARPALPPASVARLERRLGRGLPELRGVYRIRAGSPAAARRLAATLDARPAVQATVEPAPVPPPAVCRAEPQGGWPAFDPVAATPDLSAYQDYREGMDIPEAASGAGVRLADIEYEWLTTHEELAERALPAPVRHPGGLPGFQAQDHGTAVLGILGADVDGEGTTGVAHGAQILPLSPFFEPNPRDYDLRKAVLEAALGLRRGDVLLIEQQTEVMTPPGRRVFAPVEADPVMRDVIRAVVDAGVVVVEPAGNGDRDLASLDLPWLAGSADPGNSGALVVAGGGSPATGGDLARVPGSNYGARVDLQGYGAGVVTTGYGQGLWRAPPDDRAYTSCFDGTSSASATVAGAVAALQGLAVDVTGSPLSPAEVRAALVATGTPQPAPGRDRIGPRPQVAAAALYVPDEPPAGADPSAGPPPPVAAVQPSAPPRAQAAARPAARGARARLDRRAGTLTITLRGLAPRAVVFAAGRRVRVGARGRIVLPVLTPRRFVLVVAAPRRARVAYDLARFRVTVPARGPARATRL